MGTAVTTTIDICVASLLQTLTDFFKGPSGPKCPECGSSISDDLCPHLDCPIKVAQWITRWCSPEAVDIPALDRVRLEQLARHRLVVHPGELYELGQGDWDRLEDVSAGQLADIQGQMQRSKLAEPSALLFGLRLPGVDTNLAKRLICVFGSIDKLRETKPRQLQQAGELSEQQAVEIRRWFRDSVNRQALQMLEHNGFCFSG